MTLTEAAELLGVDASTLRHQIAAQMTSPQEVLIAASQKYAAVQQFGAKRHAFGPAPWGNIPARRVMPLTAGATPELTATEARFIEEKVRQFIERSGSVSLNS